MNGIAEYVPAAKPFARAGKVVNGQQAFRMGMKKGSMSVRKRSEVEL